MGVWVWVCGMDGTDGTIAQGKDRRKEEQKNRRRVSAMGGGREQTETKERKRENRKEIRGEVPFWLLVDLQLVERN